MRIISSFKDYYDIGMGQGVDRSLLYVREEVEANETQMPLLPVRSVGGDSDTWFTIECIGFCGTVYPVIVCTDYGIPNNLSTYCHSLSDLDRYVEEQHPRRTEAYNCRGYGKYAGRGRSRIRWPHGYTRKDFEKFYAAFKPDAYSHLFQQHPVFVAKRRNRETVIIYNARLRPLEFYRVFDPYQAYQELAMWLGNQAAPRKTIPVVSDADMIIAKGFDPRYSFRKDKVVK